MTGLSTEDFEGSENTLYDTTMVGIYVIIHLSKPIVYTTQKVTTGTHYGLW